MIKFKSLIFVVGLILGVHQVKSQDLTKYVKPLMGTLSDFSLSSGNTYPAVAVPWGMNFWTPQTGEMGDGWIYSYSAHRIRGFRQTHQPSPWMGDYGQFSIMPVVGEKVDQEKRASFFSHLTETVSPQYYSVYLADHDVLAEMAPTERAVIMDFTFPSSDSSGVVIDAFDKGSYIKVVDNHTVMGYTTRNSGGVPDYFRNYFILKFDKAIASSQLFNGKAAVKNKDLTADHVLAKVNFSTKRGEKVTVRVASSFVSFEQAELNLKEIGKNSLAQVKSAAQNKWNEVLGKVQVSGGTDAQLSTFYSCLYRSVLFPRKFYEFDADGNMIHYSPHTGKVYPGPMYTDTGFWDTFRSLFPLINLIYPSVSAEIQEGLANTYRESGFLPEWASPGHRGLMVGNNSASVVSDAIMKGITPKEIVNELYEAMQFGTKNVHPIASSSGRLGYQYFNTLGYIPYDVDIHENTARTLEYAYDDWCILQVAKMLKRPEAEILELTKRTQNYRNMFNPKYNLMQGRNKDGSFQEPFSPYKWGGAFTEGNSWHYTWSVFHDPKGLSDIMGGEKSFLSMLDSVFVVPPIYDASYYGGLRIHEITEMQIANMGNYAHGNQPAQHMIYLYSYFRKPWQTQYWLRQVMDKLYRPTPDGYCGDEDNGQTSAWYVFSAMGFYPVCPASDEYVLGAPLFKSVTINLENGKKVIIDAPKNSDKNLYVKGTKFNGRNYSKNYIKYSDIINGSKMSFEMDSKPNYSKGIFDQDRPYSMSNFSD